MLLVSASPVQSFHDPPPPRPWTLDAAEMQGTEEDEDDLNVEIAESHCINEHLDQLLEDLSPSEEAWDLVTLGLGTQRHNIQSMDARRKFRGKSMSFGRIMHSMAI